jgi:phosphotriesterase-related protein
VHKGDSRDLTNEANAISELQYYVDAGGITLTELTNIGIGRDPEGMKRISTATGVNVIMGCGFYKDAWIPDTYKNKSIEELTEIIISDIRDGLNGIHAGVIGEIGISRPITAFEEKVVIATARAQKATGAAVNFHFDRDGGIDERHYVLDIMESEGVDLTRVYISHNTPLVDRVDNFVTYAQRGCYVEFDMLGMEILFPFDPDMDLTATIKALIDRGYLEHILISQDVCFTGLYVRNGGYGYAHILNNLVPQMKAGGITDAQINTIMVENPKRLLPFK